MNEKALELFNKQREQLNSAMVCNIIERDIQARRHAEKVIYTGKTIIEMTKDAPFITGTYVNMAKAIDITLSKDDTSPDDPKLQEAYSYIEKALALKPSNQAALGLGAVLLVRMGRIEEAAKFIGKMSGEAFRSLFLETDEIGSLFDYLRIVLSQQDNPEMFKVDVDLFFDSIIKQIPPVRELIANILMYKAQIYDAILGDHVEAYSIMKECLNNTKEGPELFHAYVVMTEICNDIQLGKSKDAVYYGSLATKYLDDKTTPEMKANAKSQYGRALCSCGDGSGKMLCQEAVKIFPSEAMYYNFARALYEYNDLETALVWAKKAEYIVADEMNLLLVGDIYRKMNDKEKAMVYYEKAIQRIIGNDKVRTFQMVDEDGKSKWSISSPESMSFFLKYALKTIARLLIKCDDLQKAKGYVRNCRLTTCIS